jgi:hypothetical protein
MNLSSLTTDVEFISKLDDQPNDVGGLSPAELKARFDAGSAAIKAWLNGTHIPELQTLTDALERLVNLFSNVASIQTSTLSDSATGLATGKAVLAALSDLGGGDMLTAVYDPDKSGKVKSATSADAATKLATARNIFINGVASGWASFDGTKDVTISLSSTVGKWSSLWTNISPTKTFYGKDITINSSIKSLSDYDIFLFIYRLSVEDATQFSQIFYVPTNDEIHGALDAFSINGETLTENELVLYRRGVGIDKGNGYFYIEMANCVNASSGVKSSSGDYVIPLYILGAKSSSSAS